MSERSEVSSDEQNEGPKATRQRAFSKRLIIAGAVVVAAVALVVVVWPSQPALRGSVIAYRAVDDSAFLVWRVYEPTWSAWLSRVDAKGRTLWTRELPGDPHSLDSIHVSSGIIAVRYTHRPKDGAEGEDHAIVAFTLDGKQVWDRVLTPYYPEPVAVDRPAYGKTTPSVGTLGGVGVAASFVEWADTEKEIRMLGLRAPDGQPAWERVVDMPSTAQAVGSRILWLNTTGALTRLRDEAHRGFALVNSTDVATGATQEALLRGKGCSFGGSYLAVIDREGVPALVQYDGGDLDKSRVLAERFDPLGGNSEFFVESCGRFANEFVFLLQPPQKEAVGDTGRRLVITDDAGVPRRSVDLEFDLTSWLESDAAEATAPDQVPFSGELPRFVPIVQTRRADLMRDELAVFDLRDLSVARQPVERSSDRTLFRNGDHWLRASKQHLDRTLELTAYDGKSGNIDGRASVRGADRSAVIDTTLLPTHVANGKLWVVLYGTTPLDAPPLAILDATTLKPLATRGTMVSNDSAAR